MNRVVAFLDTISCAAANFRRRCPAARLGPFRHGVSSMKRSSMLVRAVVAGSFIALGAFAVWAWNARPALAVATSQNEKVITCTGPLDDSGEAVYVLDVLTGDLRAFVMHPEGKFSVSFHRNIMSDFGLEKTKTPLFTMVTGQQRFVRRGPVTSSNPGLCVTEAPSAKMA